MKPKFDLAEFLAVPAKPSTFRRRNMRSPTPAPVEDEAPEAVAAPVPPKKRKP